MSEPSPLALTGEGFGLVRNAGLTQEPIPAPARMTPSHFEAAASAIRSWEGYAPSPLLSLEWAAREASVAQVLYKHEGERFGPRIASFKALGGAYAVGLQAAAWREAGRAVADLTVCCASDGNHGRSVAWGAAREGCKAVVFVPESMAPLRRAAIEHFGAKTITVPGYDEGLREAQAQADKHGWVVVSDTSYPGYEEIPQDVMAGYGLVAEEAALQWREAPTHLILQAGVGGMAAALALRFQQLECCPRLILAEPEGAACWHASLAAGAWQAVESQGTIQAGLDCGEPSTLAWQMLKHHAHAAIWIEDGLAGETMRALAHGEPSVKAGESAVAGLAALLAAAKSPAARKMLGLEATSRVFLFGSEGVTDADVYARIIGEG